MSSRVRAMALCVLGSFVVSCGGVEGPPPDEVAAGKGDWLSGLELSVKRHVDDLHGEPQVIPDCANSALKIAPCQQVSARFLSWLNASGKCFKKGLRAATGDGWASVESATLKCEDGIIGSGTTPGGNKRQHVFRRACDGRTVIVNGRRFNYLTAAKRDGEHRRFFVAFLDCWGTSNIGTSASGSLTWDSNRGVRDWREDPAGHSDHYHLSRPCMPWSCGGMAYE